MNQNQPETEPESVLDTPMVLVEKRKGEEGTES